jgi:hypothetical protein
MVAVIFVHCRPVLSKGSQDSWHTQSSTQRGKQSLDGHTVYIKSIFFTLRHKRAHAEHQHQQSAAAAWRLCLELLAASTAEVQQPLYSSRCAPLLCSHTPVRDQLHLQQVTNIKGVLNKQEQHGLKNLPASTATRTDHQGWGQGVLWPCIAKAMSMCMSCTLSAMQIDDDDHRRKGHSTEA